ncbi:uncharacterized protein [Pleurodeles waltl]|uniref:uncharacterized protein n=1 Tax=Pleurodeles waltl TaxID=8319 RepID=UPI003709B5CB
MVYLGYMVGRSKVQPFQAKIETILAWQPVKTQTKMKAFLALIGYYRKLFKGYGTIFAFLTRLTSKNQPKKVIWTQAYQKAFDILEEATCTAPELKAPDFFKEFIL